MLNTVALVGRLTRTPELRRTNSGDGVISFTIAFDNRTKDAEGKKTASFINCTAWRQTAEIIAKYADKGSLVSVDGYLVENRFTRKDGTNGSRVEVVVNNFYMLERKSNDNFSTNDGYKADTDEQKVEVPSIELADDDLPF
ncbi:MAG TPA: single-stranded DNA-binding protein [Candidatus Onthovivens sp.]|nr:single-stranded DNA-binding protein [Candidatus Onthovivens sp.]